MACEPLAPEKLELKSIKIFPADGDTAKVIDIKLDESGLVPVADAGFIILEFNQLLDGNVIETATCELITADKCRLVGEEQYKSKIKVISGFQPKPNAVNVTVAGQPCSLTDCLVSYRPDGGFVPDPKTPAVDWPNPAIRINFVKALTVGQIVSVELTTKIQNPDGKALPATKTITFKVIP